MYTGIKNKPLRTESISERAAVLSAYLFSEMTQPMWPQNIQAARPALLWKLRRIGTDSAGKEAFASAKAMVINAGFD